MNLLGALTRFSVVHCRGVFDHFLLSLSLYLNLNYKNWRRVFSDIHKKDRYYLCHHRIRSVLGYRTLKFALY